MFKVTFINNADSGLNIGVSGTGAPNSVQLQVLTLGSKGNAMFGAFLYVFNNATGAINLCPSGNGTCANVPFTPTKITTGTFTLKNSDSNETYTLTVTSTGFDQHQNPSYSFVIS